jgi:hypothetical protein
MESYCWNSLCESYDVVPLNDLLVDPLNYYFEYVYNVPTYFSLQYLDVINTHLLVI